MDVTSDGAGTSSVLIGGESLSRRRRGAGVPVAMAKLHVLAEDLQQLVTLLVQFGDLGAKGVVVTLKALRLLPEKIALIEICCRS